MKGLGPIRNWAIFCETHVFLTVFILAFSVSIIFFFLYIFCILVIIFNFFVFFMPFMYPSPTVYPYENNPKLIKRINNDAY